MLTREQETELFVKARSGDEEAREFLIKNHLLFAARQARQMVRGKLPDDDVVSAANFAVMRAFDKFDHTLGHRFTSYLKLFIKGEIAGLWRNLSTVKKANPVSYNSIGENARALNDTGQNRPSNAPKIVGDLNPIPTEDPHREVEEKEHIGHLQAMLNESKLSLNPHEQEIIRQVYEDNQSFAEIGRKNGVTREAIRATHNRALVKLQKAMQAKGIKNTR
jgi:RNA polymerase sigma factor (sigma-70 family)